MSNKTELLQKIRALSERGIAGEKDSAQVMLVALMKKYGITEDDIILDRSEIVWFEYHEETERRLLNQIIYMVTGAAGFRCRGTYTNRKRKKMGAECTASERLDIEANYSFFKAALEKELNIFFAAFANKNHLFPADNALKEDDEPRPKDLERILKVGAMMDGMDAYTLKKGIEA